MEKIHPSDDVLEQRYEEHLGLLMREMFQRMQEMDADFQSSVTMRFKKRLETMMGERGPAPKHVERLHREFGRVYAYWKEHQYDETTTVFWPEKGYYGLAHLKLERDFSDPRILKTSEYGQGYTTTANWIPSELTPTHVRSKNTLQEENLQLGIHAECIYAYDADLLGFPVHIIETQRSHENSGFCVSMRIQFASNEDVEHFLEQIRSRLELSFEKALPLLVHIDRYSSWDPVGFSWQLGARFIPGMDIFSTQKWERNNKKLMASLGLKKDDISLMIGLRSERIANELLKERFLAVPKTDEERNLLERHDIDAYFAARRKSLERFLTPAVLQDIARETEKIAIREMLERRTKKQKQFEER